MDKCMKQISFKGLALLLALVVALSAIPLSAGNVQADTNEDDVISISFASLGITASSYSAVFVNGQFDQYLSKDNDGTDKVELNKYLFQTGENIITFVTGVDESGTGSARKAARYYNVTKVPTDRDYVDYTLQNLTLDINGNAFAPATVTKTYPESLTKKPYETSGSKQAWNIVEEQVAYSSSETYTVGDGTEEGEQLTTPYQVAFTFDLSEYTPNTKLKAVELTFTLPNQGTTVAYQPALFVNGEFDQYIMKLFTDTTSNRTHTVKLDPAKFVNGENTVSIRSGNDSFGSYYDLKAPLWSKYDAESGAETAYKNQVDTYLYDVSLQVVTDTVQETEPDKVIGHFSNDYLKPVTECGDYTIAVDYSQTGSGNGKRAYVGDNAQSGKSIWEANVPTADSDTTMQMSAYQVDYTFEIALPEEDGSKFKDDGKDYNVDGYTWNIENGKVYQGLLEFEAKSSVSDALYLLIGGKEIIGDPFGRVQLTYKASASQDKYGNNVYVNGLGEGDRILKAGTTILTTTNLKTGENKLTIRCGTSSGADYDFSLPPSGKNYNDFTLKNIALVLGNGEILKPTKYQEYRPADADVLVTEESIISEVLPYDDARTYSFGDGTSGSDLSRCYQIDFYFDIPDGQATYFVTEPFTETTDGILEIIPEGENRVVLYNDKYEMVKTATIMVDNTAPSIRCSVIEGASLYGDIEIKTSIVDLHAGIKSSEILLDGVKISENYTFNSADVPTGSHTIKITAEDNAGNTDTQFVHFNTIDTKPNYINGKTVKTDSGYQLYLEPLSIYETDIAVEFYRAKKLNFNMFQTVVSVFEANNTYQNSKLPMGLKTDGYYTTTSSSSIPAQFFDIDVKGVTGEVTIAYEGYTQSGEKLGLYIWNPKTAAWEQFLVKESDGSDMRMDVKVNASDYAEADTIRAMVKLELVSNGSDTLFWMSDTQYYAAREPIQENYNIVTEYAKSLYEKGEIGYVVHTGDLVDGWNDEKQWAISDAGQQILDLAGVPNGVVSGNHDVSAVTAENPFDYSYYWKYFSAARYENQPWWGGTLNNNMHHYDLITIGNKDFVVLYLGMGMERTEETVAWANSVLEKYSHRNAILCLHEYITKTGSYIGTSTGGNGQEVFEKIVENNSNIFMVLCGHEPGAAYNVKEVNGRTLIEILSCYQGDENNGGNGFVRLLKFADGKLYNTTYSPVLDQYNCFEEAKDEFEIEISLKTTERFIKTKEISVGIYDETPVAPAQVVSNGMSATYEDLQKITEDSAWFAKITDKAGVSLITHLFSYEETGSSEIVIRNIASSMNGNPASQRGISWWSSEALSPEVWVLPYGNGTFNWASEDVMIFKNGTSALYSSSADSYGGTWAGTYINKVLVDGLEPDTKYVYRVGDSSKNVWSESVGIIYTAPESGSRAVEFILVSDSQPDADSARWETDPEWYFTKAGEVIEKAMETIPNAEFILHTGDFVNNGSSNNQWDWFYRHYQNASLALSIAPTVGNHDNGSTYFNALWNIPDVQNDSDGTKAYYSFVYGDAEIFVVNNASGSTGISDTQYTWLYNALKQSQAKWKIVAMHKAIYSAGNHGSEPDVLVLREQLVPLLDECGADLVFQGHDHVYMRSKPTEDFEYNEGIYISEYYQGQKIDLCINPDGIIYMDSGAAGSKVYNPQLVFDTENIFPEKYMDNGMGSWFSGITVDGDKLIVNVYRYANEWEKGEDGSVTLMDSFGIFKNADVASLTERIDALPAEITLAQEAEVKALMELYEAIDDLYKPAVTNADKLLAAKRAIDKLNGFEEELPANVQEVIDRINGLPSFITLEWDAYIKITRQKYNLLSQEEKELVHNYQVQTAAEKEMKRLSLLPTTDYAAAKRVIDMIDALPSEISWGMKDDLVKARDAYALLSTDQKALVTNYSTLSRIEYAFWLQYKDNMGEDPGIDEPQTGDRSVAVAIILSLAFVSAAFVLHRKKYRM